MTPARTAAWVIQVLLPVTSSSRRPSLTARVRNERRGRSQCIGFGEDGSRQNLAGRNQAGSHVCFLGLGAAAQDNEFGGDLRSGCRGSRRRSSRARVLHETTHIAVPCARPKPPYLFREGEREDAKFGHFGDDLGWNQRVTEVPFVGMRRDAVLNETAELIADHLHLIVKTAGTESGVGVIGDQGGKAGAGSLSVAVSAERSNCRVVQRRFNTDVG